MSGQTTDALTGAGSLTGSELLHVVQGGQSRRATASDLLARALAMPAGARRTNLGTRGMWVPVINTAPSVNLVSQRVESWLIWWTHNEPFDRCRFQVSSLYTGGTAAQLDVALYQMDGSNLALWNMPGALNIGGVQVSPTLAAPVNPGPGLLRLDIRAEFAGGTGTPQLSSTGQPIVPAGFFGHAPGNPGRAVLQAQLAGQGPLTATPVTLSTQATFGFLPLLPMDNA